MYIIGDLHSNIEKLNELLNSLKLARGDSLIFLGDYIDKGRATDETIIKLNEIKKEFNCIFIKGDHEFVWERYLNHNETFRKDFLLKYGSAEALKHYTDKPEKLISEDDIIAIKKFMGPYLDFIKDTKDYYLGDNFLAIHAGLREEQLSESPIQFTEENYFLREKKMNLKKQYLNRYRVVAGHTYFGPEPLVLEGYIGLDLGAGYDGYLAALDPEKNEIIRSDGKIFNLNKKI
jgi:serine/threonine protein phosphatase 1